MQGKQGIPRLSLVSAAVLGLALMASPAAASAAQAAAVKRCGSSGEIRKMVVRNAFTCAQAFRFARSVPDRKYRPPQSEFSHRNHRCFASLVPPQNPGNDGLVRCWKGSRARFGTKPALRWELNYDYRHPA